MGVRFLSLLAMAGWLAGAAALAQTGPVPVTPTPLSPAPAAPPPIATPPPTEPSTIASPPIAPSSAPSTAAVASTAMPAASPAPVLPPQLKLRTFQPLPTSRHSQPTNIVPHTLNEALALTYSYQPALQAERAKLRATDETVPAALSGWRPQVQLQGSTGYGDGVSRTYSFQLQRSLVTRTDRLLGTAVLQAQQPLYTGGKVPANINRAKNQVRAERATLLAQEQTSFLATVSAYVGTANQQGVIVAQQLLALAVNNEIVLAKQLQATNDRFRVGEITRTDVAQAQAALAGATASRETAEGQLETARGTFQQVVGVLPPANLQPPQPLDSGLKNESEAIALAAKNNPQVIAAVFNDAAAKDAVDVAFAALLPTLTLQGQAFQQNNAAGWSTQINGYQVTANLTVPIYQGGTEYAAVRQARQQQQQTERQVEDARRQAIQSAVSAWETLASARAAAASTREQIRANEIALEGVEREAIVGSRTTLDVLNAQQTLLNSQTSLVQNLAQLVNASYAVAAAIGRLTARDMHLPVPLYDETAYYDAVKDKWVGLGDYATNQPGR
jgi:outer membrane protein